jgi:hypothetical protein
MDQTSEAEKVNQKKKYEEILTILISAGYHRARINTLRLIEIQSKFFMRKCTSY